MVVWATCAMKSYLGHTWPCLVNVAHFLIIHAINRTWHRVVDLWTKNYSTLTWIITTFDHGNS